MPSKRTLVQQVAIPPQSAVATVFKSMNLADAFAIQLPSDASIDPDVLARFIFAVQPWWIGALTNVRDAIVAGFGLKTAKHLATLSSDATAPRISIFRVFGTSDDEVVLGENDKHLDFRVSILCTPGSPPGAGGQLTLSTVVHCHNFLGPHLLNAHCSLPSPSCESQSASCRMRWVAQGKCVEVCHFCPAEALTLRKHTDALRPGSLSSARGIRQP